MEALNLHQLRILAAIVEHGSFAGAAQALGLTQPAVSAQIRHLDAFAGVPLFMRDGRRVVLTEAGRAMYRGAQEMLGTAEALSRDLVEIRSGERDRFMVGGALAYATYVLPAVVTSFVFTHPGVWISVVDGSSGDLVERVRTGALDVAIVTPSRIPLQLAEQVDPTTLGGDDLVIVETASAPFSRGAPVALRDLADVPFLRMSRRRALATALDPLLARDALEPARIVMEVANWEGLKTAVRLGLGAAVVFRSVVLDELRRGDLRLIEVDGFAQSRELALICSPQRRNERMTAAFRALLAHLEAQIPAAAGQPHTL